MNFIYTCTVYMQSVGGVAKLVYGLVPSLNHEITVKSKSGHNYDQEIYATCCWIMASCCDHRVA